MKKWLKENAKKFLRQLFHIAQRFGIDLLPRHFYSEIPNIGQLKRTEHWRKPYSLIDVRGANDIGLQADTIRSWINPSVREQIQSRNILAEAAEQNGELGFGGPIQPNCLYALIRTKKPACILQIGCGVSTAVCLMAAEDEGYQAKITCIDPYPTKYLTQEASKGTIELIEKPVEMLPVDFASHLEPGDLFFVDSTHTLGPTGEVTRIILEVLPRLRPGVLVHFHDIWLPYDYVPKILSDTVFFWHETALLMAYLSGNDRCRIVASLSQLHHEKNQVLWDLYPNYKPRAMKLGVQQESMGDYPNSIYLEITDASTT